MVRLALKNPYAVIVMIIAITIIGITVIGRIPTDILPIFRSPAVQILTFYPGMPTETVERDMTNRLEFSPNKVVILKPTEQDASDIIRLAEFTKYQTSHDSKATAYVCLNYTCKLPTTEINKMLELLQ
jgi:uncharacterized protein YyaL (SSP411 family)